MEIPKILMGRENPNGWKLESILEVLQEEVQAKSLQIKDSAHPQKDMIIANNNRIMDLLSDAVSIQKEAYKQLDAVAPNKGPLEPRL